MNEGTSSTRPARIVSKRDEDRFVAAGTLPRHEHVRSPDEMRRILLIGEIGILFIVAPLFMRYVVYNHQVPLYYALPPVLGLMLALLFLDGSFHLKQELGRRLTRETVLSILAIFAVFGGLLALFVWLWMPEQFLNLPSTRLKRWLKLLVLYPFTSVLAQEFVYRVFFFHRYGALFKDHRALILVNGLVFAFAHVLFRNWIALGLTFAGGMLFAWRYDKTRSFWAIWLEHTLWGWLIFTIGLGNYFFTGVRNPAW